MGSIAKAMKDALEATGYSELRDYQRKTIEAYLSGKDVFVSAPTGVGKSLTFELAPYTFDHLFGEACNAIVFVIFPLQWPSSTIRGFLSLHEASEQGFGSCQHS